MNRPFFFRAWFCRDIMRMRGWEAGFVLLPKPVRVVGELCQCALGAWVSIQPGRIVRRYDAPRYAGYYGAANSARWTGRDWTIHRIDWPTIQVRFWR